MNAYETKMTNFISMSTAMKIAATTFTICRKDTEMRKEWDNL
jgi:hypothetical protein